MKTLIWESTRYFNTNDLPDPIHIYMAEDEENPESKGIITFSYNTQGNPTKRVLQLTDDEFNNIEMEEYYYYEEYDDQGTYITGQSKVANTLTCYPNPANNTLHIDTEHSNYPNAQILKVTDVMGRVMKQFSLSGNKNCIDLSDLSKGVYYISLSGQEDGQPITKMIVKQ